MLTDIKEVTRTERDMYWEDIEELTAVVEYEVRFYTADKDGSQVIFICPANCTPEYWSMMMDQYLLYHNI